MHDSFTALGGMIPLINMQLGEVIIGGVGAGLYGMLLFVILAVFVAGLMVGRTPEYVGKKIEAKEVKMAMLAILVLPLDDAGLDRGRERSAVRRSPRSPTPDRTASSEILYAFTSSTAQQRLGLRRPHRQHALLQHDARRSRCWSAASSMIIPAMAIAGSLAAKKTVPASAGTFPTDRRAVRRPAWSA